MQKFVLVGGSVSKSESPHIHRTMFKLAGVEGEYETRTCNENQLTEVVEELRRGELAGINVTMPLKERAADLCDTVTGAAVSSGSINTIRLTAQGVEGSSTDSITFACLSDRFPECRTVLILGSGGSALAALAAFEQRSVYLSARNLAIQNRLAKRFGAHAIPWGTGVAGALVVNATPLGAVGESLPEKVLKVACGLIDLPYGPEQTPAVAYCKNQSIACVEGHEFLIRQAVYSFNLWTGSGLEFESVRAAL